ncbi:hypothetical protein CC77DRAFT_583894 [Alternaria alternata]|uniref:Uncharacterized protein n=1 Tax=Alternaria alternata TaxID=5599 RepID=A0A177D4E1_ALTAL|nr:hypothetical protein CC77DRAFT_583894 [Alternaria alternata]OAG13972.1 hypothetical protein CC77DRAFT_583894 [Alternaria alternata]
MISSHRLFRVSTHRLSKRYSTAPHSRPQVTILHHPGFAQVWFRPGRGFLSLSMGRRKVNPFPPPCFISFFIFLVSTSPNFFFIGLFARVAG